MIQKGSCLSFHTEKFIALQIENLSKKKQLIKKLLKNKPQKQKKFLISQQKLQQQFILKQKTQRQIQKLEEKILNKKNFNNFNKSQLNKLSIKRNTILQQIRLKALELKQKEQNQKQAFYIALLDQQFQINKLLKRISQFFSRNTKIPNSLTQLLVKFYLKDRKLTAQSKISSCNQHRVHQRNEVKSVYQSKNLKRLKDLIYHSSDEQIEYTIISHESETSNFNQQLDIKFQNLCYSSKNSLKSEFNQSYKQIPAIFKTIDKPSSNLLLQKAIQNQFQQLRLTQSKQQHIVHSHNLTNLPIYCFYCHLKSPELNDPYFLMRFIINEQKFQSFKEFLDYSLKNLQISEFAMTLKEKQQIQAQSLMTNAKEKIHLYLNSLLNNTALLRQIYAGSDDKERLLKYSQNLQQLINLKRRLKQLTSKFNTQSLHSSNIDQEVNLLLSSLTQLKKNQKDISYKINLFQQQVKSFQKRLLTFEEMKNVQLQQIDEAIHYLFHKKQHFKHNIIKIIEKSQSINSNQLKNIRKSASTTPILTVKSKCQQRQNQQTIDFIKQSSQQKKKIK